jgi:23S rRNA (cytidine1920-2'-O)/16S rRNA (cytidine1409-2'-O)-methyltransferase
VSRSGKVRLDVLLVERGLVDSREQGQRLIMAGEVLVDGQPATKPGRRVEPDADVRIKSKPRFASRGGDKLAAALDAFGIQPEGWVCADVGASTGGFTDCLLQAGAARVYAIDVGYGQLDWRLRQDARVVVMERTNARTLERLPEPVDFVSVDASFISLRLLLPPIRGWLRAGGMAVALVKPQFEAGRREVSKGGVVRDPAVHRRVLIEVMVAAQGLDFAPLGLIRSPLLGPAGNVEFLLWLGTQGEEGHDPADLADRALGDAIP